MLLMPSKLAMVPESAPGPAGAGAAPRASGAVLTGVVEVPWWPKPGFDGPWECGEIGTVRRSLLNWPGGTLPEGTPGDGGAAVGAAEGAAANAALPARIATMTMGNPNRLMSPLPRNRGPRARLPEE